MYPSGGLALAAAAMARALTLGKNGVITLEAIQASKANNKPIAVAKVSHPTTGKESFVNTAFSFANWGEKTYEYAQMIKYDLRPKSRVTIATEAYKYYQAKGQPRDSVLMDV